MSDNLAEAGKESLLVLSQVPPAPALTLLLPLKGMGQV